MAESKGKHETEKEGLLSASCCWTLMLAKILMQTPGHLQAWGTKKTLVNGLIIIRGIIKEQKS